MIIYLDTIDSSSVVALLIMKVKKPPKMYSSTTLKATLAYNTCQPCYGNRPKACATGKKLMNEN